MQLAPGRTLGPYTLEVCLGRGRLGEVWTADDAFAERKVAIKVVPRAAAGDLRDARGATALAHVNCIALYEVGETDDAIYFVMAHARGRPLSAYLADASVPIDRRLKWLASVGHGLIAAHDAGLLHRNVRPSSVLITQDGIAKLLDFGIGTQPPEYMAPEQRDGAKVDARTDQYSFGLLAYELLAGRHPDNKRVARRRIRAYAPDLSSDLADAIHKMISPNPNERHASLTETALALELAGRMHPLSSQGMLAAKPVPLGIDAPPSSQPALSDRPPTSSQPSIPPRSSQPSIPPRSEPSIPPKNADPRARALAGAFAGTFGGDPKGQGGYVMELRATEKNTHPLVLVARDTSFGGALIAGSVNLDTGSAEIRAYDYLGLLHMERRTGKPFLERATYEAVLTTVKKLLNHYGVTNYAIVSPPPELRDSVMRPRSIPPPRR